MNTEITDTKDGRPDGRVFYDADCGFCSRWAARFRRTLERRGFTLIPLQSPESCELLNVPEADRLSEMRVLTRSGRVLGGADALVHLAGVVRWGWPLQVLAGLPGMKYLLRSAYRFVARHRSCADRACAAKPDAGPAPNWIGWLPLALVTSSTLVFGRTLPAWAYMWSLAFALFAGCKWLSFWTARTKGLKSASVRTLGYLFAWPGMDASGFLSKHQNVRAPTTSEWLGTAGNVLLGSGLIWIAARRCVPVHPLLAGWAGLVGLIFVLHFGLLRFIALAWRRAGVDAKPLMHAPVRSNSLGEFWGRRWNTGFHQLASQFVFRPLRRFTGLLTATMLVFLVSGLVHELAISLPARAGYGLPTAYFLAQGAGVCFEHSDFGRSCGVGRGWRGRLFTLIVTAGPAFWLFHPPFVSNVMLPFLKAIGAI